MARRSSVNARIDALIEESVREKFETDVASVTGPRAERILARGRLYGIGGGGHLPRVKDSKTKDASLAEVSAARSSSPQNGSPPNSPGAEMDMSCSMASMSTLGQSFPFYNSRPTSSMSVNERMEARSKSRYAHDAMYSVITFESDPNKVFHNCAPSGRETSFPPWYVGYTNSTTKPLDIPSSASRYGNRGAYALKMQQSNRNSTRKIGEHLPHFLSYPNPTNEFTPKLNAAPLKPNGATFCSPKDWPDSAAYPSGFKKKKKQQGSSHAYRRETTALDSTSIKSTFRPTTTPDRRLLLTTQLDDDETIHIQSSIAYDRESRRMLSVASRAESRRNKAEFLSRPRTKHMMRIHSEGLIPQRNVKYSGNQVIVSATLPTSYDKHDQNIESIKRRSIGSSFNDSLSLSSATSFEIFTASSNNNRNADPYSHRWTQVLRFAKVLLGTTRNVAHFDPEPKYLTGVNNLDVLMQEFKYVTKKNKHSTLIYRDQFILAVTTKVEGATAGQANSLFSAFDLRRNNYLHYADVLASCLIVCKPEQHPISCLAELWMLFKEHKGSYEAMKTCGEIFTLVCASSDDVRTMEKKLKDVFRPAAYRKAAVTEIKPKFQGAVPKKSSKKETALQRRRRTIREQKEREQTINKKKPETSDDNDADNKIKRPTTTTFNLCNGIIDEVSFTATCHKCPSVVQLFKALRDEHLHHNVAKAGAKSRVSVADRVKDIQKRKKSLVM